MAPTDLPSKTESPECWRPGTLPLNLNFSFDVVGSVGGFYVTLEKTITAHWQHAPTGTVVIDGVNHFLNGFDESNDFWPDGIVIHDDG